MAKVYSYIRFSSKKQEQGDSVRRQTATGEAWLKRHPQHTLDTTLRLNDLGKSAFRGANLDKEKGDLGKFIALAEKGEIPRGSILMLEGWDRFSRMPPFKAARVFGDLVEAGVSVLTLSPEQLIDHTNIDNMEVVLPVVIGMQLAHEESRKKSQRIAEVWKARRQRATEDGEPMTKRCPAWLYWDEEAKKWKVKDGAKKTLLYIFNRTCEGIGQKRLVGELQAKFKPLGDKAKRWNGSMVAGILSRRLVLGEMTPCRRNSKPQPAIVGYYPQVIPEDLFYRARAASVARETAKGRSGKFVNLLVGLVRMPDGHPAHVQTCPWTSGTGRHVGRRLVSVGHRNKVRGSCPLGVDYFKVERFVLAMLYQLRPQDLFPTKGKTDTDIKAKERELRGVELRLEELDKLATDTKTPLDKLLKWKTDMEAKQAALKGRIEGMRRHEAVAVSKPLEATKDLLKTLARKPEAEQHDLRLKLRGLIADLVERIDLVPYKVGRHGVEARITVHYKGGGGLDSAETDTGIFHDIAGDPSEDQILEVINLAMRRKAAEVAALEAEAVKPTASKGKRKGKFCARG